MNTQESAPPATFSPFLPMALVTVSVLIFLGWQTAQSVRQHATLIRLSDRQELLASQAAQTENQLQALMMDLLQLAKTDEDARAIAAKYNIKFNPPQTAPGDTSPPGQSDAAPRDSRPATVESAAPAPVGSGGTEPVAKPTPAAD